MDGLKERVWDSLTGHVPKGKRVQGVEDAYAQGGFCMERYCEIRDAYDRLCKRLGTQDEDPDVETIIRCYMQIERYIGLRMFEYGMHFGGAEKQIF